MSLSEAPFFTDIAPGPDDGQALWVDASDGVRIRIAAWARNAAKGTVLLFPGRTEYIEKYGDAAQNLADRGFATLSVDWRGQGLADRFLDDRRVGHVSHFTDYQKDVAAVLRAARSLNMPRPFYLIGHSMGGCIGLRAVMEGLPVKAAAFTGPMWGIHLAPHMRPVAWTLSKIMPLIGRGGDLPPGTKIESYVLSDPFDDNMLTRDADMHDMMRRQLQAHPDLSLGGPSYQWLGQALTECASLTRRPSPNLPCLTFLGTNERIVDIEQIKDRMGRWPGGTLEIVQDGEHEVMMEVPETRTRVFDQLAAHFGS